MFRSKQTPIPSAVHRLREKRSAHVEESNNISRHQFSGRFKVNVTFSSICMKEANFHLWREHLKPGTSKITRYAKTIFNNWPIRGPFETLFSSVDTNTVLTPTQWQTLLTNQTERLEYEFITVSNTLMLVEVNSRSHDLASDQLRFQ